MKTPDFLQQLAAEVSPGGLLDETELARRAAGIWDAAGLQALALVRPRSTEEVSRVLALCQSRGQCVVTHGGLTGLVHGAASGADDLVLSLERMNEIERLDPVGRTLTVQAGCTLQKVQQAAQEAGLQFALDLGARGSCTIGGNVATNAGGNAVIRYGMTRDQVLGLEAVLADGTVVSSMNHMIKNNTGYDLRQLFIGSEGTLGVITRLVLRLREAPRSRCTALVAANSLANVIGLLRHMDAGLGGQLSAFEVMWQEFYQLVACPPRNGRQPMPGEYPFYVLLEAQGADPLADQARFEAVLAAAMEAQLVVDAVIASSGREREELWALRDDVERVHDDGPVFTFDVSLAIAEMQDYLGQVRSGLAAIWPQHRCLVFGHLGDGNLHLVVSVGDCGAAARQQVEAVVYQPLAAINGSVSAEHGIGLEKKRWLSLSRSAAELDVMRRLKQALDPAGILNPGKIFDPA
jgi:FAD/FMN-containing dehydrogenase